MIDYGYIQKAAASSAAALISKITLFYDFFFLLIITPAATAKASAAIPSVPATNYDLRSAPLPDSVVLQSGSAVPVSPDFGVSHMY